MSSHSPFEKIADFYDEVYYDKRNTDKDVTAYKRFLPEEPKRLVELGCGTGRLMAGFRRLGWEVFGVERSPAMAARAKGKGHSVWVGEFESYPTAWPAENVIAPFSVMSYACEQRSLPRILHKVRQRMLNVGQRFVFDFVSIAAALTVLEEKSHWEHNGIKVQYEKSFDYERSQLTIKADYFRQDGESFSERHLLRCFGLCEILDAAMESGFMVEGFAPLEDAASHRKIKSSDWHVMAILESV